MCTNVLRPFPTQLLWAGIALAVPRAGLALPLTDEVARAYQSLIAYRAAGTMALPSFVRGIPWCGDALQQAFDRCAADTLLI
jgi:hypothetical protein